MKTIMLRNIPKDVVQGIDDYKAELGIKNTTDAIYGIVADYLPLKKHIQGLEERLSDLNIVHDSLHEAVKRHIELVNNATANMKDLTKLTES